MAVCTPQPYPPGDAVRSLARQRPAKVDPARPHRERLPARAALLAPRPRPARAPHRGTPRPGTAHPSGSLSPPPPALRDAPANEATPARAPDPFDADLVRPWPNRFVLFRGDATHGVLDANNQIPHRRLPAPAPRRRAAGPR